MYMQNTKKTTTEKPDKPANNTNTEFQSSQLYPLTDKIIDKLRKKRKLSESETEIFRDKLFDAVKNNKPNHLRFLFQFKAELPVDIEDKVTGWTALMWAAWWGYTEICELLVENGADINSKDNNGWTPLMGAAMLEHTEIINYLLLLGANPLLETNNGETAYDLAGHNYCLSKEGALLKKYTKQWELIGGQNFLLIKQSVKNCEPETMERTFRNL